MSNPKSRKQIARSISCFFFFLSLNPIKRNFTQLKRLRVCRKESSPDTRTDRRNSKWNVLLTCFYHEVRRRAIIRPHGFCRRWSYYAGHNTVIFVFLFLLFFLIDFFWNNSIQSTEFPPGAQQRSKRHQRRLGRCSAAIARHLRRHGANTHLKETSHKSQQMCWKWFKCHHKRPRAYNSTCW